MVFVVDNTMVLEFKKENKKGCKNLVCVSKSVEWIYFLIIINLHIDMTRQNSVAVYFREVYML